MASLVPCLTQCSNHTESPRHLLRGRTAYVGAHEPYVDYLHLLLDRARLPASTWVLPNVTNAAAMLNELRGLFPDIPELNGIVLGRFLHRVLSPLLTWHGSYHAETVGPHGALVHRETTVYRMPEVRRSRCALESFTQTEFNWSNDFDQWRTFTGDDGAEETNYLLSA